jgi:hypothetical protein
MSKLPELTPDEENLFLSRSMRERKFKAKASELTDIELSLELTGEVWAHMKLSSWPSVLVDEAITRLRRADTRRRWEERRAKRARREGDER